MQATRLQNRALFIAGKPCSHRGLQCGSYRVRACSTSHSISSRNGPVAAALRG